MKIYSVENCRMVNSASSNRSYHSLRKMNETQLCTLNHDTVSFRGNATKGAGIGALFGLCAMGALSAMSGGLATPLAYGLYAAAFGTAGGLAGKALDEAEANKKL